MNLVNPVLLLSLILGLQSTFIAQQTNFDTLNQREMRERRIPGVQVAVVKEGRIVLSKSFGTADIQHSIPVTNKTPLPDLLLH
jgi:CubicO group peptidase (beta-lactamase class C family)